MNIPNKNISKVGVFKPTRSNPPISKIFILAILSGAFLVTACDPVISTSAPTLEPLASNTIEPTATPTQPTLAPTVEPTATTTPTPEINIEAFNIPEIIKQLELDKRLKNIGEQWDYVVEKTNDGKVRLTRVDSNLEKYGVYKGLAKLQVAEFDPNSGEWRELTSEEKYRKIYDKMYERYPDAVSHINLDTINNPSGTTRYSYMFTGYFDTHELVDTFDQSKVEMRTAYVVMPDKNGVLRETQMQIAMGKEGSRELERMLLNYYRPAGGGVSDNVGYIHSVLSRYIASGNLRYGQPGEVHVLTDPTEADRVYFSNLPQVSLGKDDVTFDHSKIFSYQLDTQTGKFAPTDNIYIITNYNQSDSQLQSTSILTGFMMGLWFMDYEDFVEFYKLYRID